MKELKQVPDGHRTIINLARGFQSDLDDCTSTCLLFHSKLFLCFCSPRIIRRSVAAVAYNAAAGVHSHCRVGS